MQSELLALKDVLGMLDGTLVPIFPPDKPNQAYFCRKGFTAIKALIVCDASLKILTINARFAGSSNDSFVYHESGLPEVMEAAYREDHCCLLGDSGYPNLPWLMVPLLPAPPPGTPGSSYNKLHAKARNLVERCIGVLKCRWRCLLVPIHYHPAKAGRILNACAVLHNLLLENNMPLPVDYEIFIDPVEDPDANPVDPNELQMLPAELRREANANRQYLIEHAHWYLNRAAKLELENARGEQPFSQEGNHLFIHTHVVVIWYLIGCL
ncbi:Putative nuclease [Frankliniella fusca]|uniref:Nuclease n=1 Tax=Frankliniella fusca TaxID=407009 RepID=A0AAE1HMP8_9NEOP|nr:Putative nuclease [Frankliniella fusca]